MPSEEPLSTYIHLIAILVEYHYYMDSIVCTDTDECAQSGNPCQENAECTDTEGGFMCQCLPGFEEDSSGDCQSKGSHRNAHNKHRHIP